MGSKGQHKISLGARPSGRPRLAAAAAADGQRGRLAARRQSAAGRSRGCNLLMTAVAGWEPCSLCHHMWQRDGGSRGPHCNADLTDGLALARRRHGGRLQSPSAQLGPSRRLDLLCRPLLGPAGETKAVQCARNRCAPCLPTPASRAVPVSARRRVRSCPLAGPRPLRICAAVCVCV